MNDDPEMLDMIKALAHADRLKIVGMLVQKPSSLEEVSAGLSLPVREVFNHLGFLQFVGVVERQGDQFCLDGKNLDDLAQRRSRTAPGIPTTVQHGKKPAGSWQPASILTAPYARFPIPAPGRRIFTLSWSISWQPLNLM